MLFLPQLGERFAISDIKLFVPVVILLTQDNAKLLQQLESNYQRAINLDKCPLKTTIQVRNSYFDFLIDPNFQGVNRLSDLLFENNDDRKEHTRYFLPKVEIKDYNIMTDRQNVFDQPVKNDMRRYDHA